MSAGSLGAPGWAISTGLLSFTDRVPRRPLVTWADRLLASLENTLSSSRQVQVFSRGVGEVVNQAALVATYHGNRDLAHRMCEGQIRWLQRMSRRSSDAGIARLCTDPWVNLGRLATMANAPDEALLRFARLNRDLERARAVRANLAEAGRQVDVEARTAHERFLETAYVIESLKTLLMSGRFADVLKFASNCERTVGSIIAWFVDEASIVAACRLHDHERAQRLATEGARQTDGWERVVFKIRLAEVLASEGDRVRAAAVLAPAAAAVGRVSAEQRRDVRVIAVLLRLSEVCGHLGLEEEALGTAHAAYAGAWDTADEPFQIETLRLLTGIAPDEEGWRAELIRLEETTAYQRYRHKGGKPLQSPRLERLYERVQEVLA